MSLDLTLKVKSFCSALDRVSSSIDRGLLFNMIRIQLNGTDLINHICNL